MPEETIQAFQDHGEVRGDTVEDDLEKARSLLHEKLPAVGVDYDDVVATLEQEGVQKFADSFKELLDGVKAKRETVAA
jgi:transaldolase